MRLLYLAYFICSTVCFVDSSAPFAEKVPECFDGRAGSITVWYLSVDPYKFEIITTLSLDLIKTSIYLDVDNANPDLTFNEELMMLSCACTDLTLNSYEYFVSPVVFAENTVTGESTQTDALTLCVFHEASKSVAQVLDIPPFSFESFMIAKYIELMPRREIDLGESNSTGRCVNERGYIMSKFPGQNTCFYVYTVKINLNLMTIDNGKPRAEKAFKYGSFLASSDFPTVKELINIEAGAEDKWVTCALLKNKSLLKNNMKYHTGCHPSHKYFHDGLQNEFNYFTCCCIGNDDPNCAEITESAENNLLICHGGGQSGTNFHFADKCFTVVVRHYNQTLTEFKSQDNNEVTYFTSQTVEYINNTSSHTCSDEFKAIGFHYTRDVLFCYTSFCNFETGYAAWRQPKTCIHSFNIYKFDDYTCVVMIYWEDGKWKLSGPSWFMLEKSTFVPLKTVTEPTKFTIYSTYLIKEPVYECSESTIEHQYYAITCYENLCDDDDAILDFTKQFDPQELEQLSKDKNIPKCGLGKWEFDDSEDMVNVSQRLKSMEFVPGIYCSIFLEKEKRADGSINLKFTFEPIHPKPKHCDEGFFKNEAFTYTCYYTPNGRDSAKQKCNLSKFFAKTTDGTETAIEPDEDDKEVIKNKVYEYYEDCEQLHVGLIGVPTRKCRPSGMGCFHSQLAGAKKDDPAAGCIGFAQKQIASKTEYYDNIGEALICITEESHDQCQYVNRDGSYYLLCCCHTYEINNHVRTCIVDSATIFHEDEHLLPRVRRYLP